MILYLSEKHSWTSLLPLRQSMSNFPFSMRTENKKSTPGKAKGRDRLSSLLADLRACYLWSVNLLQWDNTQDSSTHKRGLVLCNFLVVKQKLSAPFWKRKYIYNSPSKALPSVTQIWRPSISTSVSCLFSCCLGRDVSLKLTSLSFDLCLNCSHYKMFYRTNNSQRSFYLKVWNF